MTVTAITLADPVSGISVPILPVDGVAAQILDVAAPARAVTEDRLAAHGSYDTTQLLNAAAVSLTMLLYPSATGVDPAAFLDQLAPLLNPALRPVLIVANDAWPLGPRQMTVRYDNMSKPLSDPTNWPVQISWVAPAGLWQAVTPVTTAIMPFIPSSTGWTIDPANTVFTYTATSASPCVFTAAGSAYTNGTPIQLITGTPPGGFTDQITYYVVGASGASFSLATRPGGTAINSTSTGSGTLTLFQPSGLTVTTAGIVMAPTSAVSPAVLTNPGAMPSDWTALLYGPATGPKLADDTVGGAIEFSDDLVLNAGDFVALDSSQKSAYLNDPSQPVLSEIVFSTLAWWLMQPGSNSLRYYPTGAGAGSQAQITFSPSWMA